MSAIEVARSYFKSTFTSMDMSIVPDATVKKYIDFDYPGGWNAFRSSVEDKPVPARTVIQLQADLRNLVGGSVQDFRIGKLDEVIIVKIAEDKASMTVRCHEVKETASRDVITKSGFRLVSWARKDGVWVKQPTFTHWDDEADATLVLYGRISTPEWVASQAEQFETCYRPGTETSPMLGWIARAEASWAQMHADETFQKPVQS